MLADANDGGFVRSNPTSALARANLVDGKHYRVIMGFTKYVENGGIQLNWYLYDLDTNTVVEQNSVASWNFFTGSNAAVNNMSLNDLVGSIVLYGKFGTTCTIDKLHGVFENTSIAGVKDIFHVDSVTGEGLAEIFEYLAEEGDQLPWLAQKRQKEQKDCGKQPQNNKKPKSSTQKPQKTAKK
jgi:hypothetical protein